MKAVILIAFSLIINSYLKLQSQVSDKTNLLAEIVLDTKSALGEGAFWDANEKVLFWIDIENKVLNSYNPVDASNESYEIGKKIGTVVPISNSKVLLALEDGIYIYDLNSSELSLFSQPYLGQTNVHFNDGKCDPEGRLWVGTMANDGRSKIAALYCVEGDGKFRKMVENVSVSNGIVWTSDKKTMYYIDTPTKKIMEYDYDNVSGNISNPRIAIEVADSIGNPDGMTIDKFDNIWVAMWGGACVAGYNPRTKKMITKIEVPALNVTSVAFGGENLDVLYITSARTGLDIPALNKYPLSGSMFSIKPGSIGVPSTYFKLK